MERNCSDPKYVFDNVTTLYGCYGEFGGDPSNSTFARVVNACINDYCTHPFPSIGGCGKWNETIQFNFIVNVSSVLFSHYTGFFQPAVCDGVKSDANSDIAGPGIFVAYMMQLILASYLWFFPWVSNAVIPKAYGIGAWLRVRQDQAMAKRAYRVYRRHPAVLKHTLVEFNEAQCYFMIASQSAIFFALRSPAALAPYTLRSAMQNMNICLLVSGVGIFPVVICAWSLQLSHECSLWTMLLSVATVAVSEAALYTQRGISVDGQVAAIQYGGWPASCGGHPPPLRYCGVDGSPPTVISYAKEFFQVYNPICLIVHGATIGMWLRRRFLDSIRAKNFAPFSVGRLVVVMISGIPRDLPSWPETFFPRLVIELGLQVVMVLIAVRLVSFSSLIDWNAWTFGQVIAITLWFPAIGKYIYWLWFGTEAYSKARIPSPFKITGPTDDDETLETDSMIS